MIHIHYSTKDSKRQSPEIHFEKNSTFFKRNDIEREGALWNN